MKNKKKHPVSEPSYITVVEEVKTLGIFNKLLNSEKTETVQTRYELIADNSNTYFSWSGDLYSSDLIRSCLAPTVKACGKLTPKHIRETVEGNKKTIETNPLVYMRFLLSEPNPHMTMQKMLEKVVADRQLNGNGFILIIRDENCIPVELYPIPAVSAQALHDKDGVLFLKFQLRNGRSYIFPYSDIIHLRRDYANNDIFGTPLAPALAGLMDVMTTIDQGIVKAVKNSNSIRWLLKYNTVLNTADMKRKTKEFTENFLSVGSDTQVAAADATATATQVTPNDYVPNASQMDKSIQRLYGLFGTNERIVKALYNENEWNAFYEAEIEPIALELSSEFTRKLFTRRERGFGNKIVFEAADLSCASISTKLALQAMVDRGAMTPNEWRATLNLAPVDGGDTALLRKDTGHLNNNK